MSQKKWAKQSVFVHPAEAFWKVWTAVQNDHVPWDNCIQLFGPRVQAFGSCTVGVSACSNPLQEEKEEVKDELVEKEHAHSKQLFFDISLSQR